MTAQLMAFKISDYIYPIIFIGFMVSFLSKREKVTEIGKVIFSFGLLFEGIEIMGSVMKPLASSPVFIDLMGKVSDIPVLGVALGAAMTLVVQSSSATIAVLQNFASQPAADGVTSVIGLSGAIPILLGDNIGTTITALLASIGQSKNAKRTAVAHSVFNITGSAVFLLVIPLFSKFVQYISPKGNEVDVISRQIANAHTTFNVACTLIWLPLIPVMIKIVSAIVRGKEDEEVIRWAMEVTGTWKFRDKSIYEISGGETQRVWIATVLAQKPEIMFLDEPTTYLDISHQLETMNLVKKLNRETGIGVVMVLHDLAQAMEVSDHVIVIRDGEKYDEGAPQNVITSKMMKDVYQVECEILNVPGREKPLLAYAAI